MSTVPLFRLADFTFEALWELYYQHQVCCIIAAALVDIVYRPQKKNVLGRGAAFQPIGQSLKDMPEEVSGETASGRQLR